MRQEQAVRDLRFEIIKNRKFYVQCKTEKDWIEMNRITGVDISLNVFYDCHSFGLYRHIGTGIPRYWMTFAELEEIEDAIIIPTADFIAANPPAITVTDNAQPKKTIRVDDQDYEVTTTKFTLDPSKISEDSEKETNKFPITNGNKPMDFSEALKLLKRGAMLQRQSWHINTYVILAHPHLLTCYEPLQINYTVLSTYYRFTFESQTFYCEPYLPSSKDLNAEDWVLRDDRLKEMDKKNLEERELYEKNKK